MLQSRFWFKIMFGLQKVDYEIKQLETGNEIMSQVALVANIIRSIKFHIFWFQIHYFYCCNRLVL